MIDRRTLLEQLETALRRNPVAALVGPRQCGKTTLARQFAQSRHDAVQFFDLEDPVVLERFLNPKLVLQDQAGLLIIDEVQRRPDLFPLLRVLADRHPLPARFLILGSASPHLLRQSSESLAGRIEYIEMGGFSLEETGADHWRLLWTRGGFPKSFLADSEDDSRSWREQFIRSFVERDLTQLGFDLPPLTVRRFLTMVAHYHGQTWNSTEIAGSLGISDHTARRYLDILAGAYMIRLLPPWFENLGKRQRKAPKVYLTDSGMMHTLIGLTSEEAVMSHPKCGASWEGFALGQILQHCPEAQAFYWAVHSGPELDLLLVHNGKRLGFEFKFADAPSLTKSMQAARAGLKLDHLSVVYPGGDRYPIGEGVEAVPLAHFAAPMST